MATEKEKIKLQAIFTKKGKVLLFDQDDREFDASPDIYQNRNALVEVKLELTIPRWPLDSPYCEVTFRMPMKVEERLPDWMQELIKERQL